MLSICGAFKTMAKSPLVAIERLARSCMGQKKPEIVGFGSSVGFDQAYCKQHRSERICITRKTDDNLTKTTELIARAASAAASHSFDEAFRIWEPLALNGNAEAQHNREPASNPCSACSVPVRGSGSSSAAARCPARRFGAYRSRGNGLRDSGSLHSARHPALVKAAPAPCIQAYAGSRPHKRVRQPACERASPSPQMRGWNCRRWIRVTWCSLGQNASGDNDRQAARDCGYPKEAPLWRVEAQGGATRPVNAKSIRCNKIAHLCFQLGIVLCRLSYDCSKPQDCYNQQLPVAPNRRIANYSFP
jgi:hypothetical protein